MGSMYKHVYTFKKIAKKVLSRITNGKSFHSLGVACWILLITKLLLKGV